MNAMITKLGPYFTAWGKKDNSINCQILWLAAMGEVENLSQSAPLNGAEERFFLNQLNFVLL